MWSSVLRSLTTGYFLICLKTFGLVKNLGELDLGAIVIFIVSMGIVVIFPIFCNNFLKSNINNLDNPVFIAKYGTLIENVKIPKNNEKKTYLTVVIFLIKRLLIALVTEYVDTLPVIQIATSMFITIASFSFTYNYKPMISNYLNWIDLANDVLFMSLNYFLFLFTDYI